jgi:GT2 family glycosyltransferase
MTSILFLTLDRFSLTVRTLTNNLKNAGAAPVEILACDNGSTDKRVPHFLQSFQPRMKYLRLNSRNEGIGKAFNQLYLRSSGDYIVLLGNDLELDTNWLAQGIRYLEEVEMARCKAGMVAFDWGHSGLPPLSTKNGVTAHFLTPTLNRCFGVTMFKRELVEQVGLFCEEYGPYGLDDSDLNERVNLMGFTSFYVPGVKCRHLDNDVGSVTEYRKTKDESMGKNLEVFSRRLAGFGDHSIPLREPLPPMRDPA